MINQIFLMVVPAIEMVNVITIVISNNLNAKNKSIRN
nr:MAG TPA: hypothetical protein [Caudoviricetes sp.]